MMVIRDRELNRRLLARLELPQLSLDLLDVPSIPFPDPGLVTGGPHLGRADGRTPPFPGHGSWGRCERRSGVYWGREDKFCRDVFAKCAVDLAHLLAFCIHFLFLVVEGVRGGGCWTHGEVVNGGRQRSGEWTEMVLPDAMVIWGYHNRIEVENEGGRAVGVLGPAAHR